MRTLQSSEIVIAAVLVVDGARRGIEGVVRRLDAKEGQPPALETSTQQHAGLVASRPPSQGPGSRDPDSLAEHGVHLGIECARLR